MGLVLGFGSTFVALILGLQLKQVDATEKKIHGGILDLLSGNQFSNKVYIPEPEKDIKFTFILVKHAMAVPDLTVTETYPNDQNYKPDWKPGGITMRGRRLMFMVGRSLKSRYKKFVKNTKFDNEIKISTISKNYAKRQTADLGFGLFTNTVHEKELGIDESWVLANRNYEKADKMFPLSQTECQWMKVLLQKFEREVNEGTLYMTRCTKNLYDSIQNYVIVMDEKDREWIMNSPEKVYNLWSILIFELLQGKTEPKWAKDRWSRMQSCVFDYHRQILSYNEAIPALIIGRMIKQMEEELLSNQCKFHIHITNDVALLSANWTLPNNEKTFWPDPGDAIIYDFFQDKTIQVSSFSGLQGSFEKIYEGTQEQFFQEYKDKNIYLSQEEWNQVCSYDGTPKRQSIKETVDKLLSLPVTLTTLKGDP